MKKKPLFLLFTIIAALAVVFVLYKKNFFQKNTSSTIIINNEKVAGFYNRHTAVTIDTTQLQHYTIQWFGTDAGEQLDKISNAKSILVTLEIWGDKGLLTKNPLQQILDGKYDEQLKQLCLGLSKKATRVYLRFNPEMEVPVQHYPWQYQSPQLYINAFKHFAKQCKQALPSIKIVWSPAGYPGTEEYWPGIDAADMVSITLNSASELKATAYPPVKHIAVDLQRKLHRLRFMDRPVIILSNKNDSTTASAVREAIAAINKEAATVYDTNTTTETSEKMERKSAPILGVYDPNHFLSNHLAVKVEHLFADLGNIQDGSLQRSFDSVAKRKHDVILTIEPWRGKDYKEGDDVLSATTNGRYDADFKRVAAMIAGTTQTVYLRFAHEMEIPITRYAWQSKDPVQYIKAYRYFMQLMQAKNIKKVWGPAGDRGSIEWFPGNDVVDYISIAIYGLPDKNITDPEKQESFSAIYQRKSYRMLLVNKPIFITEFGVKGPETYKKKWMDDAANVINTKKEIIGACYFNLPDNPEVWGNIETPDWSITRATFDYFTSLVVN